MFALLPMLCDIHTYDRCRLRRRGGGRYDSDSG